MLNEQAQPTDHRSDVPHIPVSGPNRRADAPQGRQKGRKTPLVYCPSCAAQLGRHNTARYRSGDEVLCLRCGAHYPPAVLCRSRLKLEVPRLIIAVLYLTRTLGDCTRSELAQHLSVSNSPQLRGMLEGLAMRGLVRCEVRACIQNNRPCYYFSKLPVLQTARPPVRTRAFATPGASR
jgi:hypothetical protein